MGFYLRKSLSLGKLVRLNLSRGGLGVSVGVKGARVGIDARGRSYVHAGTGGIYYRKTLSSTTTVSTNAPVVTTSSVTPNAPITHSPASVVGSNTGVTIDSSSSELLQELQRVKGRTDLTTILILGAVGVVVLFYYKDLPSSAYIWLALGLAPAFLLARSFDVRRGTAFLKYEMDSVANDSWSRFITESNLSICERVWNVSTDGYTSDRKRNAGASALMSRRNAAIKIALPPRVVCNLEVFCLQTGVESLYFFPDRLFIYNGKGVSEVEYGNLSLMASLTDFVETSSVPGDSETVGHTWQYVNKDGSPDRRFKNNAQYPIVKYGELGVKTACGIYHILHMSRKTSPEQLRQAILNHLGSRGIRRGMIIATIVKEGEGF
jgi:hypothetical protein